MYHDPEDSACAIPTKILSHQSPHHIEKEETFSHHISHPILWKDTEADYTYATPPHPTEQKMGSPPDHLRVGKRGAHNHVYCK